MLLTILLNMFLLQIQASYDVHFGLNVGKLPGCSPDYRKCIGPSSIAVKSTS